MGFFPTGSRGTVKLTKNQASADLLHKLECRACPLNRVKYLQSPKMAPTGSDDPLVYIIGEAPGEEEDRLGEQFIGRSGDYVRPKLPASLKKRVRWNNTIRCHTEGNRDPDKTETECCRPSLERDIEDCRPVAIIGLGGFALSWTGRQGGIEMWRGRRFPVTVGNHTCWFYPMRHPAFILRDKKGWKADEEIAFKHDLARAVADIEAGLPEPHVHSERDARDAITCLYGSAGDLRYLLDFLDYAGSRPVAGVDFETQNVRPYWPNSALLTKAVSVEDETVAFAYRHRESRWTPAEFEQVQKGWLRFLKTDTIKVSHQLSFEMEWTVYEHGREYARGVPWQDTLTQAFVLDERVGERSDGPLSLKFLTQQYFGIDIKRLTQGLNKDRMAEERLDRLLPYNAVDAKYHRLVHGKQDRRLDAE